MSKKQWVFTPERKSGGIKATEAEKKRIQEFFQPLVDKLKEQFIEENPNKKFNYPIDIYTKWYRNYFYFCEKFKSESPNRIADEFEEKFVRLTHRGENSFDFSYFRHTGQWFLVAESLSLEDCQEMILSNPNFQPL